MMHLYIINTMLKCGGPQQRTARFPDETSSDLFLWSYINVNVCDIPSTTHYNIKERIKTSFHSIATLILIAIIQKINLRTW